MPQPASANMKNSIIEYVPDYARYLEIGRAVDQSGLRAQGISSILPSTITHPPSWQGSTLGDRYIFYLSEDEVNEVDRETERYLKSGQSLSHIDRSSFRLQLLESKLSDARRQLHDGAGVFCLRGLHPRKLGPIGDAIQIAGLSAYVSETRGRQAAGKYLVHIKDLTSEIAPDGLRVAPYTNVELPFHTDQGDVISMYVLGTGADGGKGTFASVSAIYNEIAATKPHLLIVLLKDNWPFDKPGHRDACEMRPLLSVKEGRPTMNFSRGSLLFSPSSQRSPSLPQLTSLQSEALDCVHFTAVRLQHKHAYKAGDFLVFNNRTILHGREQFRDASTHDREGKDRHILRLWLRDREMAGAPPPGLEERWNNIFEGEGGKENDDEREWPLVPISKKEDAIPRWQRSSLVQDEGVTGLNSHCK